VRTPFHILAYPKLIVSHLANVLGLGLMCKQHSLSWAGVSLMKNRIGNNIITIQLHPTKVTGNSFQWQAAEASITIQQHPHLCIIAEMWFLYIFQIFSIIHNIFLLILVPSMHLCWSEETIGLVLDIAKIAPCC